MNPAARRPPRSATSAPRRRGASLGLAGLPRIVLVALLAAVCLAPLLAGCRRPAAKMFGFSPATAAAEAALEARFLSLPRSDALQRQHAVFAGSPHIAGSDQDYRLMIHTRDAFQAAGLDAVEVTTHDVLLSWPQEVTIEMTAPTYRRATMHEEPVRGDPDTAIDPAIAGMPFHAYSASGDVTAPVVDAGAGAPGDYDALLRRGVTIRGRIALVRSAGPYSYRGHVVHTAEQRGAAAVLLFSDPDSERPDGGRAYPDGPWGPRSRIQRGSVAYDFIVPGDPLTPGWASTAGARRISPRDAPSLPRILSAPLSYPDAKAMLDAEHPVARVRVRIDTRVRPVWTVTGLIRGSEEPDDMVIAGNHRDAWMFGGVDPSGGSAALVELARTLGALKQTGWRPRRSILLASWDAEEHALISSTEWAEERATRLSRDAVAYINVDSGVSGTAFAATAVPALNRVISEAAEAVRQPGSRGSIAAAAADRRAAERGAARPDAYGGLVGNRISGGSDVSVFLNHLGIPVADLALTGPYGVYHSLYDTRAWMNRFGDPGFKGHVALVQVWGVLLLRLANAEAWPLDYEAYADALDGFEREMGRHQPYVLAERAATDALRDAVVRFRLATATFARVREAAIEAGDRAAMLRLNRRVAAVERALIDPGGLAGRPWFRHLVYAPSFSYAPEVLPGVAEAISAQDVERVAGEARRLAAALDRATRALGTDAL